MRLSRIATSLCLITSTFTSGCDDTNRDYGYGGAVTEETQVIEGFYQSIYRDEDLAKAKQFASERMDGRIDHYATVNGVARYILRRHYDRVQLTIEAESIVPYLNQQNERRVTIVFGGQYNGETIKDSRDVVLVLEEGQWRVDQILDARYRP